MCDFPFSIRGLEATFGINLEVLGSGDIIGYLNILCNMHFKAVMAYIMAGTMNFTGDFFADSCMELTIKSWIWKKLPKFWLKQDAK